MLGWVFKPKKRATEAAHPAPGAETEGDLEYLRGQTDFDAEEMAAVHGVAAAEAAPAPNAGPVPDVDDPGVTRPGIRFNQDLLAPRSAEAPRPAPVRNAGVAGELVLSVKVARRSSIVSVHEVALIGRFDEEQNLTPELDLGADDAVSRRHARIFRRGGQFWLRDLDSTNGTRHNGHWLPPDTDVPLHGGDLVELGEASELRVLSISFGIELTDEDQHLSELLDEAMGVPGAGEDSAWPLTATSPDRVDSGADLLDVALSRGTEAGLLPEDESDPTPPAPVPQWRLREMGDLELPSFVEPYR